MSDREKAIAAKVAALPPELQQRFLDQVRGAETALSVLRRELHIDDEEGENAERED